MSGAGDDCALLEIGAERLALSIDLSVGDVHFRVSWLDYREIGYRAAAASLSDLAAVAATPVALLVSLAASPEWPEDRTAEVMEGVGEAAASVNAQVVGGDLVRGDRLIVDVAVLGRLGDRPVLRSGAVPGDGLWVTGRLGGPGEALRAWLAGETPDDAARERFARPAPRVAPGEWLRDRGAHAMIDLSDGLWPDTHHIAAASTVACSLELERIPLHASATDARAAVVSGEEYELLVALPEEFNHAAEFTGRFGLDLTRVGTVAAGSGATLLADGVAVDPPVGFRHFK